jgi:hypothetical protein
VFAFFHDPANFSEAFEIESLRRSQGIALEMREHIRDEFAQASHFVFPSLVMRIEAYRSATEEPLQKLQNVSASFVLADRE